MRIADINRSDSLVTNLQTLLNKQTALQSEVSTGQRITKASDDPDAMARVLQVQADQQRVQQWSLNGDRALAVSQASYAGLKSLKAASDRAGEIAVLGVALNSPDTYNARATEVDSLIERAVQTANSQQTGDHLFGGTKTDAPPFTVARDASGKVTGVTYVGAATAAQIRISDSATITAQTDGATNQKLGNFINNLVALRDALTAQDGAAVQAAQPALHTSESDLIGTMSELGATQARLESAQQDNQGRFTELQSLTSADTDADIAQTMVKLTQTQATYQAALQSGAQLLQHSLLDYLH